MSFGKLGSGYILINGEKYPVQVTRIDQTFGEPTEFRGFFYDFEYARGGIIPVKKSPIKNVIFNNPATVVIWNDGTKTVVTCHPGDTYSKETGLALCIAKKFLGNKGNFNEIFKKWIPEEAEPVEEDVKSTTLKIGDKVRIVDIGLHYSIYDTWVKQNVPNLLERRKWMKYGRYPRTGDTGVIKAIGPHLTRDPMLCYVVNSDGYAWVMDIRGVEKVTEG